MRTQRRGASLIELMVVMTLMGILLSVSVPSCRRAVEQARADIAAANLKAIWSAQRVYWLEHHTFAGSLAELGPLLDPSIAASTAFYVYSVTAAGSSTFSVTATRIGSSVWTGQLVLDQTGMLTGSIHSTTEADIVPGFQ